MMRPASMQTSRSATCSRMWTICSIQTMAMPRRLSSRIDVDEFARLAVGQAAADLVEQQHRGIGGERARQFEALAVDQAERLGAPVGDAVMPAASSESIGALVGLVAAEAAAVRGGGEDVLEHRHAAERPRNLMGARESAPAALGGRQTSVTSSPRKRTAAARSALRADQDAEQRRLAGAVRADDADRLVGADREVDAVEHHKRVEALVESLGVEQRSSAGALGVTFGPRRRSAVVRHELGRDRHVRIGGVLGDDVVELELASRPSPSPIACR